AGARTGGRRGGAGAAAGRRLPSPDGVADWAFAAVPLRGFAVSGTMMLTGGIDWDDGKSYRGDTTAAGAGPTCGTSAGGPSIAARCGPFQSAANFATSSSNVRSRRLARTWP